MSDEAVTVLVICAVFCSVWLVFISYDVWQILRVVQGLKSSRDEDEST